MTEIITDPEDRRKPRFYKRVWQRSEMDPATGASVGKTVTTYHPDWRYEPKADERYDQIGEGQVKWDQLVMHVKVGGTGDMRWGIPEVYSALDWARAVKNQLEDYATVSRSLARWAWNLSLRSGKDAIAAARDKLNTGVSTAELAPRRPRPLILASGS